MLVPWQRLWSTVLPQIQPLADANGFGGEWENMCNKRTHAAAYTAARAAAYTYTDDAAAAAAAAAYAAYTAAARARAAVRAADAAADAAAYAAARARATLIFWENVDPIGVLERMTYVEGVIQ